jgi:hypothetical protein
MKQEHSNPSMGASLSPKSKDSGRSGWKRTDDGRSAFGSFTRKDSGKGMQAKSERQLREIGHHAGLFENTGAELMSDYRKTFRPLNMQLGQELARPSDDLVNEASIDTALAFDKSREIMTRDLSRMGVNPISGRFAGLEQKWSLARAAAEAGAKNRALRQGKREYLDRLLTATGVGANQLNSAMGSQKNASNLRFALANQYGSIAQGQAYQSEIDKAIGEEGLNA